LGAKLPIAIVVVQLLADWARRHILRATVRWRFDGRLRGVVGLVLIPSRQFVVRVE